MSTGHRQRHSQKVRQRAKARDCAKRLRVQVSKGSACRYLQRLGLGLAEAGCFDSLAHRVAVNVLRERACLALYWEKPGDMTDYSRTEADRADHASR